MRTTMRTLADTSRTSRASLMLRTSSSVTHSTASASATLAACKRVLTVPVPGEVVHAPALQVLLLGGVRVRVDDDDALAGIRQLPHDPSTHAMEAEDNDVVTESAVPHRHCHPRFVARARLLHGSTTTFRATTPSGIISPGRPRLGAGRQGCYRQRAHAPPTAA